MKTKKKEAGGMKYEVRRQKTKNKRLNDIAFRSKGQPLHISYFVAQILGTATV